MGLNTPVDWIVCYDMADRRRLARIFRTLKAQGVPVQRSVFLVRASAADMARLREQLMRIIDLSQDDVRAYRIPANHQKVVLGPSLIPAGMLLGCGIDDL